jgi:hypothetical protein
MDDEGYGDHNHDQ